MTSFAFILGCVPLWIATRRGRGRAQILGTAVIAGMLAATGIAIFLIPALFVLVERLAGGEARAAPGRRRPRQWRMSASARSLGAAPALGLSGCAASAPTTSGRPSPVPRIVPRPGGGRRAEARSLADSPWWDVFGDPVLKRSCDEALRNGYDARIAAARVEEARALAGSRGRTSSPASATRAAVRARRSATSSSNPDGSAGTTWTANVNFAWELDLWGRIRRLNEPRGRCTSRARRRGAACCSRWCPTSPAPTSSCASSTRSSRSRGARPRAFQETYDLFSAAARGRGRSALETARAEAALGECRPRSPRSSGRSWPRRTSSASCSAGPPAHPARRAATNALPPDGARRPPLRAARAAARRPRGRGGARGRERPRRRRHGGLLPALSLTGALRRREPRARDPSTEEAGVARVCRSALPGRAAQGSTTQAAQARGSRRGALRSTRSRRLRRGLERARPHEARRRRSGSGARRARVRSRCASLNLRYHSGLAAYFEVLDAQQQLFPAEIAPRPARRDQLLAVVSLYRALGGGWPVAPPSPPPSP